MGHLFSGQPAQGPSHGDRARAALRHRDRRAPRADGRSGSDGAPDSGGSRDRSRDAVPVGRGIDRRDRLRRQRRRDGPHVPGARRRGAALGHRSCASGVRRRSPRSNRRAVAAGGARVRHRRHRHPRPRAPLPERLAPRRPARLDDGRRRPRARPRSPSASSRAPISSATTGSRRATAASSPPASWRGSSPATA